MFRLASTLSVMLVLLVPQLAGAQELDLEGERVMLDRINALRAEQHLAPLTRSDILDAAARAHSAEMAASGALTHTSSATGSPEDRVQATGFSAGYITENVAMHRDASLAHEALLGSAPHRTSLLNPTITHVGLGAVRANGGVFVTQLLVEEQARESQSPAVAAAQPEAPVSQAAPADDATSDVFGQLIPPSVEHVLPVAGALAAQAVDALPVLEPMRPTADPEAPSASDADPIEASEATPSELPQAASPPAASASPIQQLVDLAQALLRATTAR